MIAGRFLRSTTTAGFRYALALTTIVETIMDLGLSQVTVRTVARDKAQRIGYFPVLGLKIIGWPSGSRCLGSSHPS